MINTKMKIALLIHIALIFLISTDPERGFLAFIPGVVALLNVVGIALILSKQKKTGAWIFLVSSAILVPIGMIGAIGARQILDEEKKNKFYNEQ